MKPVVAKVRRPTGLYGWSNCILYIDLSTGSIRTSETAPYVPAFLGGRGLAAALLWEGYPQPVEPFSPENPLIFAAGALTGSRAAYSGRSCVAGFSPQGYPYRWFSRSNIGGHMGGELKRAGYDALVVTGASATPVRILIRDDEVSLLPAEELWGQDALQTIASLESLHGEGVRSLTIGPAGERLSRIATIQTASSSAAGHGGYGAVMGSKKLKAISAIGSGTVALADPERVAALSKAVGQEARSVRHTAERVRRLNEQLAAEGAGSVRAYACTESCPSPCGLYYRDVPGCSYDRTYSGQWCCVGSLLKGLGEEGPVWRRKVFDWRLGSRAGFELNYLTNAYGLNQWDLLIGMVPWLEACQAGGLLSEINGMAVDWSSSAFWSEFVHAIAYRQGLGDALAEGGWAAARSLHLGEDSMRRYYTAWGHAGHWDGHGDLANYVVFPYWLVSALQWLTDTRDPIPSGHGYASRIMSFAPMAPDAVRDAQTEARLERVRALAEHVYGTADALDPEASYSAKGEAAVFHIEHSVMKDCLPADDFVFPLIYSWQSPDGLARVAGVEGPQLEHQLFVAGTGTPWDAQAFEQAALRVYTLERAICVRHWGRDRQLDELVLPSFEYPENWRSPWLAERQALDRQAFAPQIDAYYARLGWDTASGWPTAASLSALGLPDVDAAMRAGAERAQQTERQQPVLQPVAVRD